MILVTGDIHGEIDIHKLKKSRLGLFSGMTKEDYLIICGDFGLVWDNRAEEKWWLEWLLQKPFTTLFVDGNHENFDLLYQYPVEEWHGGRIHRINDSVLHLMRGQVFDIGGKSFFAMGGAESHDKQYRKEGISWWPRELPSAEEYSEAEENLKKHGNKVDYIITHCAPTTIQKEMIARLWNDTYQANELTDFLERVWQNVSFEHWYCGHYHEDVTTLTEPRMRVLFDDILRLTGK